jgi:hypothetical protein
LVWRAEAESTVCPPPSPDVTSEPGGATKRTITSYGWRNIDKSALTDARSLHKGAGVYRIEFLEAATRHSIAAGTLEDDFG